MNDKKYVLNIEYINYNSDDRFSISEKDKGTVKLTIKKSLFIGKVFNVQSEKDVVEILKICREKYSDSKHIVYAYILSETGKYSDDGEPNNTAGKPLYNILEKEKLMNTMVVVIRYFGGILLGKGSLRRAYTKTVKDTLKMYTKTQYFVYKKLDLKYEYSEDKKVQWLIKKTNSKIIKTFHEENINMFINVPEEYVVEFDIYLNKPLSI